MILLSLASRQIWPQVLAVAHLKPERVVLLHSDDAAESRGPAERLARCFEETGLVSPGAVDRAAISDADFSAVEKRFDDLQAAAQLPLSECVVNFTGGNKLMATAAFRWAARRGVRACYLERRNQLTWFEPRDGDVATRTERVDPATTNTLDPLHLLACQFGEGAIAFGGERIALAARGAGIAWAEINARLRADTQLARGGFDFRKWLHIANARPPTFGEPEPAGQNLEYAVAVALLRHGVPCVRRSVELQPGAHSPLSEGELDLVFNWRGRLWVVDCKDKAGAATKLDNLQTALVREGVNAAAIKRHLDPIRRDLEEKDIKILREDIAQVAEVGGLLGSAIAVRAAKLPRQAEEFARSRRPKVEVVLKADLDSRLRALLAR